ncbi:uncharacterized protein LOC108631836 [Ceratina calcarata]|uniref:Uncharacterized protein LOC108631836 n=1 Tax=Ceratina calcarata TaxID=156304 RepID=A0AAJ7NEP6_9HYME|nr:uncharacterized protein LOC108631836 [Ceratina calcarata]
MSVTSTSKLLTEAAGVKIYMTGDRNSIDSTSTGKICVIFENIKEAKALGRCCGFHLTKSKWDPYPWVSHVEVESLADTAGLKAGDCLISIDGKDVIGWKIKRIAALVESHQEVDLKMFVWRYVKEEEKETDVGIAVKGPLPEIAGKLANAVSGIVRALECPVCLESSLPPVSQCVHGHIVCVGCRPRTPRCPVCRVRLGQGRCLLADKLHKTLVDVFDTRDNSSDDVKCRTQNLRDRLFGKSNERKQAMKVEGTSSGTNPCQLLLTKLFRSGLEKAASADNLATVSLQTSSVNTSSLSNFNRNERLNLYDRAKSASTGELSKETTRDNINSQLQNNESAVKSLTSTSPTPVWGGSTDSVASSIEIVCPSSKQSGCRDIIAPDVVLEHLSETHQMPQVHFYSICVKIPVPFPLGSEAMYILHHGEDLFFIQCEEETVWIGGTGKIPWEWSLHGQGENGAEIKIRRSVASLIHPMVLTSQHIAPLPDALLLHTLNIQLIEYRSEEQHSL